MRERLGHTESKFVDMESNIDTNMKVMMEQNMNVMMDQCAALRDGKSKQAGCVAR